MRPVAYQNYKFSMPNSRNTSPTPQTRKSQNKLTKLRQALKPLHTIQKQQKISPYHPITNTSKNQTIVHSVERQRLKSTIFSAEKPRLNNNITDLDSINKRLKAKNIRVHTMNQQKTQFTRKKQDGGERVGKMGESYVAGNDQVNGNKSQSMKKNARDLFTREKTQESVMLTPFQQKQAKIYEIFYFGERRIQQDQDFTDVNGDPLVKIGDSIMFRYEILAELGRGAFGRVFKAYDHKRDQLVALKIIKNHIKYQRQAKVQIKLLEQAILDNQSQKSNIVKLKHAFLFRGHPCLSFQLLHKNLYQWCQSLKFTGISLNLLHRLSIQLLNCLNFLQKHKIIHCDIKPENIMLKKQNKTGIKVVDFGSGCFKGEQIYNYIQSRYYRAPQIVIGVPYGMEIDMWSFGCVIVQLFTGVPVFPGASQCEQLSMFMEVLGLPPKQLLNRGNRSHIFFNQKQQLKPNQKLKPRIPLNRPIQKILRRSLSPQFIDFIKKILRWVPEQRMKPSQALQHPWIINGIPEELRSQHLKGIYIGGAS